MYVIKTLLNVQCDRWYCHYGQMLLTNFVFVLAICCANNFIWFKMVQNQVGQHGVTMHLLWLCLLMLNYWFNCNSGDLTNTSSQICGSWYLPIFLLRDGSLTLISIASLIVLVILWSSLPTMLKLSRDTSWPVVL